METTVTEIAPDIFRLSTFLDEANLPMNQFLVADDEPLLFHTGQRALFPAVSEAVERLIPLDRLRWITFGHVEADECGSMNSWLEVAPAAEVAHAALSCAIQIADLADRPPRPLRDGDVLDTGHHRVRHIDTPHIPHGWDAGLMFDETTSTLLCGDLFTMFGRFPAFTDSDMVGPALAAEDNGHPTCLTPALAPTLRALADLDPRTLAPMHAPAYEGDCDAMLRELAAAYEDLLTAELARQPG